MQPLSQPEALIQQAQQARKAGQLYQAAGLYSQAAELYRAAGHELRLAHTLRHAADVLRDDGKLAQAEPLYLEALALYRAHPEAPHLDLANALRPLALLREAQARQLWTEARDLYDSVGVEAGVNECSQHLQS